MRRAWRFLKRVLRTAHSLARNRHLPVWLRVLFVIGCIQIPVLPIDEVALLLAVGLMWAFYRPALRAAWESTR